MATRFRCAHCGKRLRADEDTGARVRCPHCQSVVTVTENAAQEEAVGDDDAPLEDGDLVTATAAYLPTWGTSVMLHMALILVALMGTWVSVRQPFDAEYDTTIVSADRPKLVDELPSKASRTTRKDESDTHSTFVFMPSDSPLPDVAANALPPVEVIGLGGGGDTFGGLPGFGDGRGPSNATSDGWFPVRPGAGRVVYVIDRSGSMTDSIVHVKLELRRTINQLSPRQKFHVIFYSTGPGLPMPAGKLVPAIPANKQVAYDFIDGVPAVGQTDPSDALTQAFAQRPDVIYLLTDGEFDRKIIDQVDRLNRNRQTVVNTICFLYDSGRETLETIAARNGGSFKFVSGADLNDVAQR